jgi:polysaccharide biosynthesis protein PslJ
MAAGASAVVAVAAGLGVLGVVSPILGIAAAVAVLSLGLTAVEPVALAIMAFPALVAVQRVGGESTSLSVSDFVLFAAFWPALIMMRRSPIRELRILLWLAAIYQASVLLTVVVNFNRVGVVEWFHSALLVAGALVVGWAVGISGRARLAMNLFMAACCLIAVVVCVTAALNYAHGDFSAAYVGPPFNLHKNFSGSVLAFAAVVAYARPLWLRWRPKLAWCVFALCFVAMLATQSRQALISLAFGVAVIALRRDPERKRSKLILLPVVPLLFFVYGIVRDQAESGNQFNSLYQRLTWYDQSIALWDQSPWFGVGLRWWYTGEYGFTFQPPNAELEMLSTAGLLGLIGFLALIGGSVLVLWKIDPRFGTLAVAVMLVRFIQGQFDLFWVAVQVSIPFAIAGLSLGVMAIQQDDAFDSSGSGRNVPRRGSPGRDRSTAGRPASTNELVQNREPPSAMAPLGSG